jgi:predicted alpha/beta superfamily hydrolase
MPPQTTKPLPVVYLADGLVMQVASVVHSLAQSGLGQEMILVGLLPGPALKDMGSPSAFQALGEMRAQEYLEEYRGGQARFAAHERFVLEEVIPLLESRWHAPSNPALRAVMGQSNGAAWALTMAARHPETFSTAIAISFGWQPALKELAKVRALGSVYLSAGLFEPDYLARTQEAALAASPRAARLRLDIAPADHSQETFDRRYGDALSWAFPPLLDNSPSPTANQPPTP